MSRRPELDLGNPPGQLVNPLEGVEIHKPRQPPYPVPQDAVEGARPLATKLKKVLDKS